MTKPATLKKLRSFAFYLTVWHRCFGWKWEVLSQKQVAALGTLDPPCAMITGTCGPFHLDIHADGDGVIGFRDNSGNHSYEPFPSPLDMSLSFEDLTAALEAIFLNWHPQ